MTVMLEEAPEIGSTLWREGCGGGSGGRTVAMGREGGVRAPPRGYLGVRGGGWKGRTLPVGPLVKKENSPRSQPHLS